MSGCLYHLLSDKNRAIAYCFKSQCQKHMIVRVILIIFKRQAVAAKPQQRLTKTLLTANKGKYPDHKPLTIIWSQLCKF